MALISIVMITYGHEHFIQQAIEGVLMQECEYSFELIISNDKSPDNTDLIIRNLLSSHPRAHLIKYISHKTNLGMMPNFLYALKEASGNYIALCEGDDYWTDPFKLQKQVNFLENNDEFSISFSQASIVYEDGITPFLQDINKSTQSVTTIYDLLSGNYIHTATVIFRNRKDFPDWLINAYPGDWPLHIINATYGNIKFFPEVMANYRVHTGGVHSTTGGDIEKSFETFHNICKELKNRGLDKISKFAFHNYNHAFASFYGFKEGSILKLNRFQKASVILIRGNTKLKMLFWIPILFGKRAINAYSLVIKATTKLNGLFLSLDKNNDAV